MKVGEVRSLPYLETNRLTLRLAEEMDIPDIVAYYCNNRTFLTPWEPKHLDDFFTADFWQPEISHRLEAFHNDQAVKLFLFDHKDIANASLIGSLNVSNIVRGVFQTCTIGYSLAEHQQHKGYMTEAMKRLIPYVFETLNLHRIQANYMPHNQASGRLLKRLGFAVEGYARNYLQINDRWEDHILTSLVNPQ